MLMLYIRCEYIVLRCVTLYPSTFKYASSYVIALRRFTLCYIVFHYPSAKKTHRIGSVKAPPLWLKLTQRFREIPPPTSVKSITCAGLCGTPGQPRMSNHLDDQLNQLNQYVFELVDLIDLIDLTDACRNQLNQLNKLHSCGWAAHLTNTRFRIIQIIN